jgi:hypothetical protein
MKRFLAVSAIVVMLGAGCSGGNKTPVPTQPSSNPPSATVEPSEEPTEAPTPPAEDDPTPAPNDPPAEPKPSATGEEPPAIQFLKRWGQKYPNVEEATIMSTACVTCSLIDDVQDWETNSKFAETIAAAMGTAGFGEVSSVTAGDFAVDANQNVCPTLG